MNDPLFNHGQLVATPAALQLLANHQLSPLSLLARHLQNDSDCCKQDLKANDLAIEDGSRIFSLYKITAIDRVYVITEAMNDSGVREATTVLLPSEY